jgi:DNA/RNA-binding domain of Phe-tRNA-synthetase-like protein
MLRQAEDKLKSSFPYKSVTEHPQISSWREAYRKFGAKPKRHPSSIENLVRRVLKGEPVRHINKLVDIYNAISLRHLLPVGGEDTDQIQGDVLLTLAGDSESPVRLLGEEEEKPPHVGEVIYKDDIGTICRRWNWKEADRTKLREETRNALLVIESLPPLTRQDLAEAIEELTDLVTKYCGGRINQVLLDQENREFHM